MQSSTRLSRYHSSGERHEVDNGVGDDDDDIGKRLAPRARRGRARANWNDYGGRFSTQIVRDGRVFRRMRFSRILYLFKPLVWRWLDGVGRLGEMHGNGRMAALIVLVVTTESDFHPLLFFRFPSLSLSLFFNSFCSTLRPFSLSSCSFAAVKIARADCWTNNSRNERISLARASFWDGIYIFHSLSERIEVCFNCSWCFFSDC